MAAQPTSAALGVLLVEDSPADAALVEARLAAEAPGAFEIEVVQTLAEAGERVRAGMFGCALLDLGLPDSEGIEGVRALIAASGTPLVVLTGRADDAVAIEAVQAGAQDYLVKGSVDGATVARSIRYAVERAKSERAMREAEERFRLAFSEAPIGIALVTLDGRLIEVNPALCELTGYQREELQTLKLEALAHPDDAGSLAGDLRVVTEGGSRSAASERALLGAHAPVWASVSFALVRDAGGRPVHAIVQIQDLSERKRFEQRLQYMTDHDSLTGLVNRRRFAQELGTHAAQVDRYGVEGGLLLIDLDHFKYVNDSLGHAAGDELILSVASLLRGCLRESDTLARLGGDEFAVLLPKASREEACAVSGQLLRTIRDHAVVSHGERPRRITASAGVAMFEGAEGGDGEGMLVNADLALYDAKEAGRDRAELYASEQHARARTNGRLAWADRIRAALDEERFVLHAQPIVNLRDRRAARYELVLRMTDDTGDLTPPGDFLHVAEQLGLIQAIDRWVAVRAIELLAGQEALGQKMSLEVNVSGVSLGDAQLLELIEAAIDEHRVDPTALVFEITETAAVANVHLARSFAARLADLGCQFALDDFGAGFGSFYYLKHLPFDFLKIDGEFVKSCVAGATDQLVIEAVVSIARGLGKQTIAECVEDEETALLLRKKGVDFGQGFWFAGPAPFEQAISEGASPTRASSRRPTWRRASP